MTHWIDTPGALRARREAGAELFEPEGVVLLKGKGPSVENVAAYVFDGVVEVIRKQYPGRGVRYTVEVTIQETENNIFIIEKAVTI